MTTVSDNLKQHGFSPIVPQTFAAWINERYPESTTKFADELAYEYQDDLIEEIREEAELASNL